MKSLGKLAAGLAHELNNPASAVVRSAKSLVEGLGAAEAALRWVAYGCAARSLARGIETAASRIFELVEAVKGFTNMDRETALQPVDVSRGLRDTLNMLRAGHYQTCMPAVRDLR